MIDDKIKFWEDVWKSDTAFAIKHLDKEKRGASIVEAKFLSDLREIKAEPDKLLINAGVSILKLEEEIKSLKAREDELKEALKEISEGKGAFSLNHLEHAKNTITNMNDIAKEALS